MAAMIPPCAKDVRKDGVPSTVVVKMKADNNVIQWASVCTAPGLDGRAVGIVHLYQDIDAQTGIVYMVITPRKITTLGNYKSILMRKLSAPPFEVEVEWIRGLDRRLQRLFEWGDCWADTAQIQTAIDDGDKRTLVKCFPALKAAISLGYTEHLPAVAEGQKPLLCLMDAGVAKEKLYIEHELSNSHVFSERGKNWECTVCNSMLAARCVCGAQRCKLHEKPPDPLHKTVWKQSENDGAPFFVHDPKWMHKEHKVEWIRDELSDEATLTDFAQVYVRFFADKMCADKRRRACLELYRTFNPDFKHKKESELPPVELQEFQRVFEPEASPRCHWCSKQLLPEQGKETYCSSACAKAANPPRGCKKCPGEDFSLVEVPRHCAAAAGAPGMNGMARCKSCGHAAFCELEVVVGKKRKESSSSSSAPQHWTKRRRS